MTTKSSNTKKHFILDTSLLLFDGEAIEKLGDNLFTIPNIVFEEVDRYKNERSARGQNARMFVRWLDTISQGRTLRTFIPLSTGGKVRTWDDYSSSAKIRGSYTTDAADHKIIHTARRIQDNNPEMHVELITMDGNMRLEARSIGIHASPFHRGEANLDTIGKGYVELTGINHETIDRLQSQHTIPVSALLKEIYPNQFLVLQNGSHALLGQIDQTGTQIEHLRDVEKALFRITARNAEQKFALSGLKKERIKLHAITGPAGSGKTLLSLLAGLHLLQSKSSEIERVLIVRPLVQLGKHEVGFLPGDLNEKISPFTRPIFELIDFISSKAAPRDKSWIAKQLGQQTKKQKSKVDTDPTIDILALPFLQGMNIRNSFVVVDEAQNLHPSEVFAIATRGDDTTKMVFCGDPEAQTVNPYLDKRTNGLSHLMEKMKGDPLFSFIKLNKVYRSKLTQSIVDRW